MKKNLIIYFILNLYSSFGQDFLFPYLKKSDPEFETHIKYKYESELNAIDPLFTKKQKEYIKSNLLERYNSALDILRNEMLIDNGLVYQYVDSVFQLIKAKNPQISCRKVYIINETYANAFTSSDGHIFITSGMLSTLKSFEELAFILAHEISHNEMNHFEKKLIYQYGIIRNDSIYDALKKLRNQQYGVNKSLDNIFTNQYILKGKMSKRCEIEADSMAFSYVQSCGVSKQAAISTFKLFEAMDGNTDTTSYDVVKILGLPTNLDYSRSLNYTKQNSLGEFEEKKDTLNYLLSTHPYPSERIAIISKKTENLKSNQKATLFAKQADFEKFLIQATRDAIYYSFLMKNVGSAFQFLLKHLHQYPNDHTFDVYIPLFFSVLGVHKKNRAESEIVPNPSALYSESYNKLLHFFRKLKPIECAQISSYYLEKNKQNSNASDYAFMLNCIIEDNLLGFKINYERYKTDTEFNYNYLIQEYYLKNKAKF